MWFSRAASVPCRAAATAAAGSSMVVPHLQSGLRHVCCQGHCALQVHCMPFPDGLTWKLCSVLPWGMGAALAHAVLSRRVVGFHGIFELLLLLLQPLWLPYAGPLKPQALKGPAEWCQSWLKLLYGANCVDFCFNIHRKGVTDFLYVLKVWHLLLYLTRSSKSSSRTSLKAIVFSIHRLVIHINLFKSPFNNADRSTVTKALGNAENVSQTTQSTKVAATDWA